MDAALLVCAVVSVVAAVAAALAVTMWCIAYVDAERRMAGGGALTGTAKAASHAAAAPYGYGWAQDPRYAPEFLLELRARHPGYAAGCCEWFCCVGECGPCGQAPAHELAAARAAVGKLCPAARGAPPCTAWSLA